MSLSHRSPTYRISDLERRGIGHPLEELGVGLAGAPVVGRDTEPQPVGPELPESWSDVLVQIFFPKALRLPGSGPLLPLLVEIEAGPELLDGLPIVAPRGTHRRRRPLRDVRRLSTGRQRLVWLRLAM
jgi:hypothetical protein